MALRELNAVDQVDRDAQYRIDSVGTRAVVVPAMCRLGVHRLGVGGYRLTESARLLRVRCDAGAAAGEPGHDWLLRSHGEVASVAELDTDDTVYSVQ